jgi:hypothetical protein
MLQKTKVWKTLERGSKKEERGREREGEIALKRIFEASRLKTSYHPNMVTATRTTVGLISQNQFI